jgi:hypothetical protein
MGGALEELTNHGINVEAQHRFVARSGFWKLAVDGERARFLGEPDISKRTRIDHTCLGNSGRFWPTISPLFQGR